MGQLLRLTRGRCKPYASLPRIDWSHPLTAGLAIYLYDMGGQYVDLVNGGLSTQVGASGRQMTQAGYGLKVPLTGYSYMPPIPASKINALGGAVPYSAAMGTIFTGALNTVSQPDGAVISVQDSANTENTVFGFNGWSNGAPGNPNAYDTISCVLGNANNAFFNQGITLNLYQSWGYVATGASAGTLYSSGKFDNTSTIPTTFSGVTLPQMMFNTASINSGQTFGNACNGFQMYYGGWGRALSAQEFLLLHQDPYGFLIYPEDEMLAILVGKTAAAFAPSLTLTGVT